MPINPVICIAQLDTRYAMEKFMSNEPSVVDVLKFNFRYVFSSSRPQTEAEALVLQAQLKQLVEQLEQHGYVLPGFNPKPDFESENVAGYPWPGDAMRRAIQRAYRPVYDVLTAEMIQQAQQECHDMLEFTRRSEQAWLAKQKA